MLRKLFPLLILLFLSSPIYSQNYQSEKDSLRIVKDSLAASNLITKAEIDSLTNYLSELEKKVNTNQYELAELKKKLYLKKYGKENGARVSLGRIWKGMTLEMLEDEWGKPDKTNTDKHPWGVFTQLFYGDITYFFKNSILIDWEEGSKK
jgi:hypothetical protein